MAVAELAYRKWIEAGKPEGRDMDFWLLAEKELRKKIKFYYFYVYP